MPMVPVRARTTRDQIVRTCGGAGAPRKMREPRPAGRGSRVPDPADGLVCYWMSWTPKERNSELGGVIETSPPPTSTGSLK